MKPETKFIQFVHSKLPKDKPYREKMSNIYTSGTWDIYYEGSAGRIFWVEYKYILVPQLKTNFTKQSSKTSLTAHQQAWGRRLFDNKIPNAVVLGWGERNKRRAAAFEALSWLRPYDRDELHAISMNIPEYCNYLMEKLIK